MALDNYNDLQTSIAAWMDRTDLGAVIPDFIRLFETTANAELPLRTRFNLAETTIDTVANTATIPLPEDFLELTSLINTATSNPIEVLNYYTPAALYTRYANAILTPNRPRGFTYVGSTLELAPVPDAVYPLRLTYYQKVTPLSATNSSNWLLSNFPNLYLFGALTAAEAYLGSDPRLQIWSGLYSDMVAKLAAANERGQYGGGALAVKGDVVA